MTKHIHLYNFKPNNKLSAYDVDIFQCAYDEICISIQNNLYCNPAIVQYDIPIKEKAGIAWKANKTSISCDSGKAADIIEFFARFDGYARATVQKLIFDNPKNATRPGL